MSHSPSPTAATSGARRAAEPPRSPSQSRMIAGGRPWLSTASAAAVTLAPLPCGRPRLTTWAPADIATSAVPSPEASSATQSSRRGERPAQRGERRGDPIGLVAGGDDHGEALARLGLRHLFRSAPPSRADILPPMADIEAHITGNVWKIEVAVGDTVEDGDTVAILESMKMEIPVEAEDDGTVKEIRCAEGDSVSEGDVLIVLE